MIRIVVSSDNKLLLSVGNSAMVQSKALVQIQVAVSPLQIQVQIPIGTILKHKLFLNH